MVNIDNGSYEKCSGIESIGEVSLASFMLGLVEALIYSALLIIIIKRNFFGYLWKSSSINFILPIYLYVLTACVVLGLTNAVDDMSQFYMSSVVVSVFKWLIVRSITEGLSIFFLHTGIGVRAMRNAMIGGVLWGVVDSAISILVYKTLGFHAFLVCVLIILALLFLYYIILATIPYKFLNRRPATTSFALLTAFVLLCQISAIALKLGSSAKDGFECTVELTFSIARFVQVLIVIRGFIQDSFFWQGLYYDERSNLNEPLLGIWSLDRATVKLFAESFTQLERKVVPLIPFSQLALDTTRFFSGGSARVYRGILRDTEVALKLLFCIELSPDKIVEFCNEATLLNSLQHENVIRCHGVCVMPPAICLVTEYCTFGSLFDFLHSTELTDKDKDRTQESPRSSQFSSHRLRLSSLSIPDLLLQSFSGPKRAKGDDQGNQQGGEHGDEQGNQRGSFHMHRPLLQHHANASGPGPPALAMPTDTEGKELPPNSTSAPFTSSPPSPPSPSSPKTTRDLETGPATDHVSNPIHRHSHVGAEGEKGKGKGIGIGLRSSGFGSSILREGSFCTDLSANTGNTGDTRVIAKGGVQGGGEVTSPKTSGRFWSRSRSRAQSSFGKELDSSGRQGRASRRHLQDLTSALLSKELGYGFGPEPLAISSNSAGASARARSYSLSAGMLRLGRSRLDSQQLSGSVDTGGAATSSIGLLLSRGHQTTQSLLSQTLPPSLRLRMCRDCCSGLAHLHKHRFLHCDIKSLNFLVTSDMVVKLADLGEARNLDTLNIERDYPRMPRNINWSPPEVLSLVQQPVRESSDVWSLAMVLAEVLGGEVPFDTLEYRQMKLESFLEALRKGRRPSLPHIYSPEQLGLSRAWDHDPAGRCSAGDLLRFFEEEIEQLAGQTHY